MIQMYGLTLTMEDKCQGKLCQLLNFQDLRNKSDIKVMPIPTAQDDGQSRESQPTRMMTHTQTGTEIKSPARYT